MLAGLAGLAAGLFVLQQLRTRYRDVTVVTTLFWKQVIDEAPVRKFRERFRHPLAYALILAICSLIWLAFAEPQFAGTRATRRFTCWCSTDRRAWRPATGFARPWTELERHVVAAAGRSAPGDLERRRDRGPCSLPASTSCCCGSGSSG